MSLGTFDIFSLPQAFGFTEPLQLVVVSERRQNSDLCQAKRRGLEAK